MPEYDGGHSPLPWSLSKKSVAQPGFGSNHPLTIWARGKKIGSMIHFPGSYRSEAEANVTLAIEAVNSYASLKADLVVEQERVKELEVICERASNALEWFLTWHEGIEFIADDVKRREGDTIFEKVVQDLGSIKEALASAGGCVAKTEEQGNDNN